jgi:hypothetical protein
VVLCVLTWHGRLFVEGGRCWLSIGRHLGADVARLGNTVGGGCQGGWRCRFDGVRAVTWHACRWGRMRRGGGVVWVRLVVASGLGC